MREKRGEKAAVPAEELAKKQRAISISEFFSKNRHLLGFDNPRKALLTTIKEGVDNSLDACEEARILPDLKVQIHPVDGKEDRFRVIVEDNGPGIVRSQVPKIFGRLLYGSKFHTLKMARGQQGIGISAAGMYGQLTTGTSVKITSRISARRPAHFFEVRIDTERNAPQVLTDREIEWDTPHGTKVEIELMAKVQKGRQSVEDYLKQTAIANPHVSILYNLPEGGEIVFPRVLDELPPEPKEIKPHPYGVELGVLIKMLGASKARTLRSFLRCDFSRVSSRIAGEICQRANLPETLRPKAVAKEKVESLYRALNETKIMKPPTDCISAIGEASLVEGLKKEIQAAFYTGVSRSPTVYRGNPFLIEVGLAYGGDLVADGQAKLFRFANRVPLMYQQSACAITRSVITTDWRKYGLSQARGALPQGPLAIMVHMASVWVPFTSESKEAIAHYPEIIREIKLGLMECGRRLGLFISRRRREADADRKRTYIEKYIPHIGIALREILSLKKEEEDKVVKTLKSMLERSRE